MNKETLEKANELAKKIDAVERTLKGVNEGGELQIASWVKIDRTFRTGEQSQAGAINKIQPKDDFIGVGLMNLLKGYLEYLNKQLEKL